MVKNVLAGPKNNHMAKNEVVIGKYSLRYHAHKNFKALCEKNDKRDIVDLYKRMFYGAKLLSHKETWKNLK